MDIDLQRCFFELRAGREATAFIRSLEEEIARLRLTDAERALIEMLADHPVTHEIMPNEVATLRGLLERMK